jgi:hypothetical protein
MNLFEVLPWSMFSVLTSKNRALYVEALFVLRKAFKQEMTIGKSDLVSMLIANLSEMMVDIDFSEDNDDTADETKEGVGLSASAHFILRHLKNTGWIETEYQSDSFTESVTLPDYTVKIINLLYSLTDESTREYNSYVYSTYSNLKTADQEQNNYLNALTNAYDKTVQLVDELKTLHGNIRRFHQKLSDISTANEVLKSHFDDYRNQVIEQFYHPIKTFDSVPRFRAPILDILGRWLTSADIQDQLCEQAVLQHKYLTKQDAVEDLIMKIGYIMDIYEHHLDEMLDEIDHKNTAYTRASTEKMQYLLKSDRSIKGKVVEILKQVAVSRGHRRSALVERMSGIVKVSRQGYIDERSLYARTARERRGEGTALEIVPGEEGAEQEALEDFMERASKLYSHERVMGFMRDAMSGTDVLTSQEIPLPDDESFIMLLLASIKGGGKNVFYNIEFTPEYIQNNGYRVPGMLFIRKDDQRVVRTA